LCVLLFTMEIVVASAALVTVEIRFERSIHYRSSTMRVVDHVREMDQRSKPATLDYASKANHEKIRFRFPALRFV
jgi:hypothetical protein